MCSAGGVCNMCRAGGMCAAQEVFCGVCAVQGVICAAHEVIMFRVGGLCGVCAAACLYLWATVGFNVTTRDNISVCKDTIGYLPTINAPATQLSTVHQILIQAAKIKDEHIIFKR